MPPRDSSGLLEVLAGDTVVRIDTTYEGETLATLVTSIEALAQEMWPAGMAIGPSAIYGP